MKTHETWAAIMVNCTAQALGVELDPEWYIPRNNRYARGLAGFRQRKAEMLAADKHGRNSNGNGKHQILEELHDDYAF
jgi:hypothetical protein